jgi:hypothetical protein
MLVLKMKQKHASFLLLQVSGCSESGIASSGFVETTGALCVLGLNPLNQAVFGFIWYVSTGSLKSPYAVLRDHGAAFTKCFHNSSTIVPSTIIPPSQSGCTKFVQTRKNCRRIVEELRNNRIKIWRARANSGWRGRIVEEWDVFICLNQSHKLFWTK